MYHLLIETSSESGSIGLSDDGRLLASSFFDFGYSSGHPLFQKILTLFEKASLNFDVISSIGVGIGPGSYTTIRIALSAAKGLSLALSCPVIPIESLSLFLPETAPVDCTAIHYARSRGFYGSSGHYEAGFLTHFSPPKLLSLEVVESMATAGHSFVSSHVDEIGKRLPHSILLQSLRPSKADLHRMAQLLEKEKRTASPLLSSIQPLYLEDKWLHS